MDDNAKTFMIGVLVGTFLIAPFIWTALGRELAKRAIERGAKVARETVEEWIKRGEES